MPQQQQRPNKNKGKNQQRRDAVLPFVAPPDSETFHKELKAEERLALRPQQRELQGEVRAEKVQRHRMQDYFDTYNQAVQRAPERSESPTSEPGRV